MRYNTYCSSFDNDNQVEGGALLMSRRCDICGKGPTAGNNVSHANNHTRRVWNANIQSIRIVVDGQRVRRNVCTKCIKSNRVQRAI